MSTTPTKNRSRLMSTQEAADYCAVHPETLKKACRAHEVAHYKGKARTSPYKFRREDLDRWMNSMRVEAVTGWDW